MVVFYSRVGAISEIRGYPLCGGALQTTLCVMCITGWPLHHVYIYPVSYDFTSHVSVYKRISHHLGDEHYITQTAVSLCHLSRCHKIGHCVLIVFSAFLIFRTQNYSCMQPQSVNVNSVYVHPVQQKRQ